MDKSGEKTGAPEVTPHGRAFPPQISSTLSSATSKDEEAAVGSKPESPADDNPTPPEPPEGGPEGVKAIIGAWGVYFVTWGYVGSWSVFQSSYESTYLREQTASQISWIGSLQLCMVYFSTVIGGRMYDSGHLRTILLVATLTSSFGFMMASISTQYWHYLLSQGVVTGIGLGIGFSPAVACVSSYYRRKRGLANGLLSTGSAIGGTIIPIYLSKMINSPSIGLGWALRTSGFICFFLNGMGYLLMRQKATSPSKAPLLDFSVFKQRAYLFNVLGYFFTTFGIFFPVFYIQPFAISKGVDPNLAFYSIAILNGISIFGRLFPSIAADRVGTMNVLFLCLVMAVILIYAFVAIQNFAGVAVFSALNGVAYGCYVTLNPVVSANLSDHPSRIGTHIGMAFILVGLAAVAGPPALGAVITATGQYWQAAIIAGTCCAIGLVFIGSANVLVRRRRGTWRV